jgi:hypothetical protein
MELYKVLDLYHTRKEAEYEFDKFVVSFDDREGVCKPRELIFMVRGFAYYFRSVTEPLKLRGMNFDQINAPLEFQNTDLHHAILMPCLYMSKDKNINWRPRVA